MPEKDAGLSLCRSIRSVDVNPPMMGTLRALPILPGTGSAKTRPMNYLNMSGTEGGQIGFVVSHGRRVSLCTMSCTGAPHSCAACVTPMTVEFSRGHLQRKAMEQSMAFLFFGGALLFKTMKHMKCPSGCMKKGSPPYRLPRAKPVSECDTPRNEGWSIRNRGVQGIIPCPPEANEPIFSSW